MKKNTLNAKRSSTFLSNISRAELSKDIKMVESEWNKEP